MGSSSNLILGTAGHIDHGKSSLVLALTGTDPDRLAEEKKRGITIELGFAQLELPNGTTMGVVDVPGHERFVRHMVQGATGVDVALLVVAADDGVMPQTKEHLAVLQLLGVKSCVIALTKVDLVDEEWLEFIRDDVENRLRATPFAGAPIVACSSVTGQGLDELRAALDAAAAQAQRTKPAGDFRLPVDRAFSVKGFGTVVTGTLWSGKASVGDEVEVLGARGSKRVARIRSVQMHGRDYETALAGNRVAVSLVGLSLDDVHAGDFLAASGMVVPTDRFDARFSYVDPFGSGKPLKSGSRVHVCHGTREVIGRVLFMNGVDSLMPGAQVLAQIRLEEPLPVSAGDRFVVRSYSPVRVIAGGQVVLAHPRRRTNLSESEERMLAALAEGDALGAAKEWFAGAKAPARLDDVRRALDFSAQVVEACVSELVSDGALMAVGGDDNGGVNLAARDVVRSSSEPTFFATPSLVQKDVARIENALKKFHAMNPQLTGIPKDTLRQQVDTKLDSACFDALLSEAEARGLAVVLSGEVSHPQAGAGARAAEQKALETVAAALQEAGRTPPKSGELAAQLDMEEGTARRALRMLAEEGRAVQIEPERYYDADVLSDLQNVVVAFIGENGPSTAADLKDAMGVSRKFAVPLLEHFDEQGITRREEDLRSLR